MIPLIIHGEDIVSSQSVQASPLVQDNAVRGPQETVALSADAELCRQAVESSAAAFPAWSRTRPSERRSLFFRLATVLRDNKDRLFECMRQEIGCSAKWADINVEDTIETVEHIASVVAAGVLSGTVPESSASGSCAVVLKEPLGVVLGIAPWNAPLILGLRAVISAVAAGNTAILKGSELSPRTHYMIARAFREAGFSPGVVNFLVHRPEEAASCYEAIISHPAVRKCNFTGSSAVGRLIAMSAAAHLKPVLLELGGKNTAVVLEDADLDVAAGQVLVGAFLNSGQICMSTDIIMVQNSVLSEFMGRVYSKLASAAQETTQVINSRSADRIQALIDDARLKGGKVTTMSTGATLIENLTTDMDFWRTESFGPVVGVCGFDDESECISKINESEYGLTAAIFTRSHLKGFYLGREINSGAVHINGMTVHDEPTLPHGGSKQSGYGRFGGAWGLDEFLQTKTIITNP